MFLNDKDTALVELETIIDNLPLVVLVLDTSRRIVLANRRAEVFTGFGQGELNGIWPGEAFECEFANVDENGCGYSSRCNMCFLRNQILETISKRSSSLTTEGQSESKNIGSLDLRVTTSFIEPQEYVLVSIEDVTAIKAIEREKVELDKLQVVIEIAGAVCHEMNQPMQVLLGYTEIMLSSKIKKEREQEYLSIMREQIGKLMETVGKLHNINRYRTSEYTGGTRILDIADSSKA